MAGVNHCGDCTMCCKLLGVAELPKRPDKWCDHCEKGSGCAIYDSRPKSCAEYECMWLQSQEFDAPLPLSMRPDKSKVVLDSLIDGKIMARCDPGYPMAWQQDPIINVILRLAQETMVIAGVSSSTTRIALNPGPPGRRHEVHKKTIKLRDNGNGAMAYHPEDN